MSLDRDGGVSAYADTNEPRQYGADFGGTETGLGALAGRASGPGARLSQMDGRARGLS